MRVGSVSVVRDTLTGTVLSALIDGVLVVTHLLFLMLMVIAKRQRVRWSFILAGRLARAEQR